MIFINQTKCCSKCKEEKPVSEFSKTKKGKYGVGSRCKSCDKCYRVENSEKIKQNRIYHYKHNKDYILQKSKQYANNNKETRAHYLKEYVKINNDKIKLYKKEYENKRKSTDNLYRLKHNIRNMMGRIINGSHCTNAKSEEILHCTFEFFMSYVETKFQHNMSWDNRSEWHIDHIIPLSFASTEKELEVLNHYTNLRPIWKNDNLIKSDRIIPELCLQVSYVLENIPRLSALLEK